MTRYFAVAFICVSILYANESNIKNDNTMQINVDDFGISTQYPEKSNNSKELTFIIRNRSKVQYLFSIKKNSANINYISLPPLENHTETISIGQNDFFTLRSLSPPAEDITLSSSLK